MTVTKFYKTFLATYPPVGSMIRVFLVDEDDGSFGEAQNGFSGSAEGDFYESLYFHRTRVLIVCQYIFIVIRRPEVQYTTAVIHTGCSLALRILFAVASTSLRYPVSALCGGDKNAYRTLMETDHDIIPALIDEFANADDGEHRAKIVEVIWQYRLQTTVSFLASALNDDHPEVWKQAIDGLVTIGGRHSVDALNDSLVRSPQDDNRSPWITEAIDHIRSQTM